MIQTNGQFLGFAQIGSVFYVAAQPIFCRRFTGYDLDIPWTQIDSDISFCSHIIRKRQCADRRLDNTTIYLAFKSIEIAEEVRSVARCRLVMKFAG
ncbi:hypothetical protein D3C71_1877420 [compost metagenome]